MMRFIHNNAMQVAAMAQALLGVVFQFTHFSAAQTAALAAFPPAVGTFAAGMVLSARNGKATT